MLKKINHKVLKFMSSKSVTKKNIAQKEQNLLNLKESNMSQSFTIIKSFLYMVDLIAS